MVCDFGMLTFIFFFIIFGPLVIYGFYFWIIATLSQVNLIYVFLFFEQWSN